jgi:hypothetical protein
MRAAHERQYEAVLRERRTTPPDDPVPDALEAEAAAQANHADGDRAPAAAAR